MNIEKIGQKIDELEYRIKLDNYGLNKADYNIRFAKRLGLTQAQIDKFKEQSKYYSEKIIKENNTYDTLKNCYKDYQNGWCAPTNDYLFKCTLPYEKVDSITNYQTSIVVDADVVRLFANGVDYNDVISCLDNEDIKGIESTYKRTLDANDETNTEVGVEFIDNCSPEILDEPVTVKYGKTNSYKGLIASSAIYSCYPINGVTYKDLNGDTYHPGVPSFDDITTIQSRVHEKQKDYDRLHDIETIVKTKMDEAIFKMDTALNSFHG